MRVIKTNPVYLYLSVISFYFSSFSIAFMPLNILPTLLAIIFWLGILAGFVFTLLFTKQRRWDKKYIDPQGRLPACLRFFSNTVAVVFDSLMFTGMVILIVTYSFIALPELVIWGILFLTVFSLEMHCVFNGKNYTWLSAKRAEMKK